LTIKKVFIGSLGPHLYDDTDPIDEYEGDFSGENRQSLVTDGQMLIEEAPDEDNEVPRLKDLQSDTRRYAIVGVTGKRFSSVNYKITEQFRYLFMMTGI